MLIESILFEQTKLGWTVLVLAMSSSNNLVRASYIVIPWILFPMTVRITFDVLNRTGHLKGKKITIDNYYLNHIVFKILLTEVVTCRH